MSGQLEAWLLARCSENLYFAHALEFQLRASCLPAAAPGAGAGGAESAAAGDGLPGQGAGSTRGSGDLTSEGVGVGGSGGSSNSDGSGDVIDRVGRRAVELLLEELAEKGEQAARQLVDSGRKPSVEMEMTGAVAAEGTDPESSALGRPGEASSRARVKAEAAEQQVAAGGGGGGGGVDDGESRIALYRQTLDFLSRLAEMASSLTPLSKAERTPRLKEQLAIVGKNFLGAAAGASGSGAQLVYVPLGDRHHRVVAVHPSESFAFSTRERAPCFVCLEVVSAREPTLPRNDRPTYDDGLDDVQGEDQRRGLLGGRAGSLRQWLPNFRFPGVREWILSVGGNGEGEYGGRGPGGAGEEGGRRRRDGASGAGGSLQGKKKRPTGEGRGGEGERRDDDRYYSLLMEEGREGAAVPGDGRGSLSDAPEWWADSSRSEGMRGTADNDAGVGDDRATLGDMPGQRWLPPPSSESTNAGGALLARQPTGKDSAVWAEEVSGQRVAVSCDDCGAEEGVQCRSGCPSKELRSAVAAVAGAGKEGEEEEATSEALGGEEEKERTAAQPQVLFNELWHDKSNRIRRWLFFCLAICSRGGQFVLLCVDGYIGYVFSATRTSSGGPSVVVRQLADR